VRPELLFRLREVDEQDLVAGAGQAFDPALPAADSRLDAGDDLAALFGVELADPVDFAAPAPPPPPPKAAPRPAPAPRKRAAKRAPPAEEVVAPPAPTPAPRARRSRRAPPAPTPAPTAADAPAASAGLPKGTRVRMLGGIHAGRRGIVTWRKDRGGDPFTYAVRVSVDGRKATTQVSSTSQGRMWEVLPG
jgi:hypothetical protein